MKFDHQAERVQLSLLGPQILYTLQEPERSDPVHHQTKWRPEYASFMIEGACDQNYVNKFLCKHTHTLTLTKIM